VQDRLAGWRAVVDTHNGALSPRTLPSAVIEPAPGISAWWATIALGVAPIADVAWCEPILSGAPRQEDR